MDADRLAERVAWANRSAADAASIRDLMGDYAAPLPLAKRLLKSLATGAPCLLLVAGPRGSGKTTLRRLLAYGLEQNDRDGRLRIVNLHWRAPVEALLERGEVESYAHGSAFAAAAPYAARLADLRLAPDDPKAKRLWADALARCPANLRDDFAPVWDQVRRLARGDAVDEAFAVAAVPRHDGEDGEVYAARVLAEAGIDTLLRDILTASDRRAADREVAFRRLAEADVLLLDLGDYPRGSLKALERDLAELQELLFGYRFKGALVLFSQVEWVSAHSLFGKFQRHDLPLSADLCVGAWNKRFEEPWPFDCEATLRLAAAKVGGNHRAFRNIVARALAPVAEGTAEQIAADDVLRAVAGGAALADGDGELVALFRSPRRRKIARAALDGARNGGVPQAEIVAGACGGDKRTCSAVVAKLRSANLLRVIRDGRRSLLIAE